MELDLLYFCDADAEEYFCDADEEEEAAIFVLVPDSNFGLLDDVMVFLVCSNLTMLPALRLELPVMDDESAMALLASSKTSSKRIGMVEEGLRLPVPNSCNLVIFVVMLAMLWQGVGGLGLDG